MKKLILFLTVNLFLCNLNFSQHFVKEGRSWNIASFSQGSPATYTHRFLIKNQIEIQNKAYYHVYTTDSKDSVNWKIFGYVREDSTAKVFFSISTDYYGILLYDFNAKLGDTLSWAGGFNQPCRVTVTNIDTVMLLNGSLRKRISVQTLTDPILAYNDSWIDGIGSITNPLFEPNSLFCLTDYQYYLLCAYEDGVIVYPSNLEEDCYINTATNETEPIVMNTYPNPANNFISIRTEFEGSMRYQIYDQSGKFLSQGIISGLEKNISVINLKAGAYFILFQTNDKRNSVVQFIKN